MKASRITDTTSDFLPDLRLGLDNLRAHKLRSLLTMLGMIFGVAAVVAMLSIGAGAQQEVMAFIEQLGVRNLIIEAREAPDQQALQKIRKLSAGLSFRDFRMIEANLEGVTASSARKRFTASKMLPRPQADTPIVYGVSPGYVAIANLKLVTGRFFDENETAGAAPLAVLGEAASASLFGAEDPVGRYVKVNEQWFRVIGVVGPQVSSQTDVAGIPAQDRNNLIYVPVVASILRLEDSYSRFKDEIDGIYLQLASTSDVVATADVVRGILDAAHRGTDDFALIVPAQLLAEQRRTQRIFGIVMVALASISLLVGGIGIMNIMLASVLERTREIGIRRALGARQADIVLQFLIETVLLAGAGGVLGVVLGLGIPLGISHFAGVTTVIKAWAPMLAFSVSVVTGIAFGIYPAMRAAKMNPVEALRHE